MGEDVFPRADAWWMNANTITLFTGLSLQQGISSIDLMASQRLESVSQPLDGGTVWSPTTTPLDIVVVQMWLAGGKCLQFEKVCKEAALKTEAGGRDITQQQNIEQKRFL